MSELDGGAATGDEQPGRERDGDPYAVAREIALRQLTVRARTRVELARALARKHVPEEVAETVLDRLAEVGLIDDAVFARDWLAAGGRRQKSRRVLLGELAEKGVDRELIDVAAGELDAERDYEVASGFAARKAATLVGLEPTVRYRRLAGALARRGFSSAVVAQVTRETLAELREQQDFD
jgi:regulatory protein